MYPHAAEPVEVLRGVMHRVKRPPASAMEKPVRPVARKIANHIDFDRLEPHRLAAQRTKSRIQARFEGLRRHDLRDDKNRGREKQQQAHERLCEEARGKEVNDIREPPASDHRLHTVSPTSGDALDDKKDRGEDHERRGGAEQGLVVVHGRWRLEQRPALMVSTMPRLRSSRTIHAVCAHNIGTARIGHHGVVNLQHPNAP